MVSWRSVFSYTSIKFVTVRSPKLALLNWALRLGVFLYVILYTVSSQKGYQRSGGIVGTVSPKVKGVGINDRTGNAFDIYDGVVPAVEQDSLFVTTKFLRTRQTRGVCPGDSSSTEGCVTDADCAAREGNVTSNGISTGDCDEESGFCLIETWCPLEQDVPENFIHVDPIDDWTVFVKSNVRFPDFDISRTNAFDVQGTGAPTLGQNLFTIRDLIEGSNYPHTSEPIEGTGSTVEDVKGIGAIIQVTLMWNCDFDKSVEECKPRYVLQRLDNIENTISTGFNYRLMRPYYSPNATTGEFDAEFRDLFKIYGIRFVFNNNGRGGKFDLASLTVTLGAGLALLGLSTIVCDYIMVYFMSDRTVFKDEKYKEIDPEYLKADPLNGLTAGATRTPEGSSSTTIALEKIDTVRYKACDVGTCELEGRAGSRPTPPTRMHTLQPKFDARTPSVVQLTSHSVSVSPRSASSSKSN